MSKFQKTVSVLLLIAVLLLLVFLPKHISSMLDREEYIDWLRPKRESFRGEITIWHVVRFKPYLGSLGSWLKKYASAIEKKHFGVYLNVESMAEEEAARRVANGEMPDIISFPPRFLPAGYFIPLAGEYGAFDFLGRSGEELLSVPYAASCRVILYDPGKLARSDVFGRLSGGDGADYDEFKNGKAELCIADAGQAGEAARLLAANKFRSYEVMPFEDGTELVQFIGILTDNENKYPVANEFISLITGKKAQQTLVELGLAPLCCETDVNYDNALDEAYRMIFSGLGATASAFIKTDRNTAIE